MNAVNAGQDDDRLRVPVNHISKGLAATMPARCRLNRWPSQGPVLNSGTRPTRLHARGDPLVLGGARDGKYPDTRSRMGAGPPCTA
jgi:hypothetical protein